MYKIVSKEFLNSATVRMEIEAELIAKKVEAGQFIIFRIDEFGERVPLTIAGKDCQKGTITIIFAIVGYTTQKLSTLGVGDMLLNVVGPLGQPTHIPENTRKICVIGGGLGSAIALPQAISAVKKGYEVDVIAGFRNKDLIILEEDFRKITQNLTICTDDGSAGFNGFVTDALEKNIKNNYNLVIAIGSVMMMKFVTEIGNKHNIPVIVSLNPIMVDGTGMCGCCRVTVGGKIRYACVDGPDFYGADVDFDELLKRNNTYFEQEKHACKIGLNG